MACTLFSISKKYLYFLIFEMALEIDETDKRRGLDIYLYGFRHYRLFSRLSSLIVALIRCLTRDSISK